MSSKKIGVFPGSFDPFTKGHESIVNKALDLFDAIIIGVGVNTSKKYLFETDLRIKHIESLFSTNKKVSVQAYTGLTVDFCKKVHAKYIIRGLRDSKDFVYERSIAQMNLEIAAVESLFFMTEPKYAAVSATIVREIHKSGGKIDAFVTKPEKLVI